MNNFASPVHLGATVLYYGAKAYAHRKVIKYAINQYNKGMPYLRGSKYGRVGLHTAKPATLAGKIQRLERRVARQAPEIRYWRQNHDLKNSGVIGTHDLKLSNLFAAETNFREVVTGEKWRNLMLKFALAGETVQLDRVRVIIYQAKRTNATLPTPVNNTLDFTNHYDPNEFTFYYDRVLNSTLDSHIAIGANVKLGFDSIFDDTNVTKGLLQMRIVMEMASTAGTHHARLSTNLVFNDK